MRETAEEEKEKWFQTERSSSLQRGLINICHSAGRSAVEQLMWQCPAASAPANYQWTHRRSVLKCPSYCYRGSHQINVFDWLQRCCAFCSSHKIAVIQGIVLLKNDNSVIYSPSCVPTLYLLCSSECTGFFEESSCCFLFPPQWKLTLQGLSKAP